MRKFMLTFVILPIFISFSCSGGDAVPDQIINNSEKDVTIQLRTSLDITEQTSSLARVQTYKGLTRAGSASSDSSFTPDLPAAFKAYFVAAENKGQYKSGKLVKTVSVNDGTNTITVPAMKYKVFVSNYDSNKVWSTTDPASTLPESTTTLYYYGTQEKDLLSDGNTVDITLSTPYAAVAIYKNSYVSGKPVYKDGNAYDEKGNWYYLYIRNSETDTEIPINLDGMGNQTYTLQKDIAANQIYQYTLTATEASFIVKVNGFSHTYSSDINI
ncbi:MAG: hypothetical protein LKG14_06315 [Prevotella sp.]|uniref:Uncharacterized protein n=1 Tax=Segatella cerevisiae TaxID=2053716 RepID=A0ABT1BWI9_9BACT|nr:hypothetical protein [Segatella cerevisiae]MCI1246979.1 hypothetical protein [Prevotella sp.]MCO6025446.1 hypothetical protein [Segatella cerevisiae]